MGTEQQSAGDPEAQSRTALDRTASGTIGGSRCTTTNNSDTRIGKPPVFSGDESTWSDWSFKWRSYVSVVDLQLGRMMEAAELARKANTLRARKARTRAKESTRVNTRAVLSLKAIVVTVESGDTSKKTVDIRTLLPKWTRRNLSNLQTAVRAAARHESHHHLLVCFQLELRSPRRERSPR